MKILINYADDKYKKTQKFNSWTGKHIAKFDKIYSFGPQDIEPEYQKIHQDILSFPRGNGLWLWKAYFIDKVLNLCNEGDYIFYIDSGSFFLRNADILVNSFRDNEKIWVSDNPTLESCFTKPECFVKMESNSDEIKYTNQIQGGYLIVVCCDESKKFIQKWLKHCEDFSLISPAGNNSLELQSNVGNGFVAHREDQSILSILCKKEGIKPHRDPSQRGFFPETFYNANYAYKVPKHEDDKYKSFVFLHKTPNVSIIGCLRTIKYMIVCKLNVPRKIRMKKNRVIDGK